MGDRSAILITNNHNEDAIVLYGHWSGTDNLTAVKNVLGRTGRIGDSAYLSAELFHEFANTLGGYDGSLSFGIMATSSGYNNDFNDNPLVIVNADTGEYCIEGEPLLDRFGNIITDELEEDYDED
jgi:hypothetical protein